MCVHVCICVYMCVCLCACVNALVDINAQIFEYIVESTTNHYNAKYFTV